MVVSRGIASYIRGRMLTTRIVDKVLRYRWRVWVKTFLSNGAPRPMNRPTSFVFTLYFEVPLYAMWGRSLS